MFAVERNEIRCTFDPEHRIDPDRDYRRVIGWEKRRDQGGTNALRGREPLGEWACIFCVEKLAKGLTPGQHSLL